MQHHIGILVLAAVVAATTSCEQTRPGKTAVPGATTSAPVTSKVPRTDAEPVLLLDDEPTGTAAPGKTVDNSRCHVCHVNFATEELAASHARAGVGCARCHGESDAHIADESWASGGNGTAPEIMFLPAQINPACMNCHLREKIDTEDHQEFLAKPASKKVCTDCHGEHRLPSRKCKWK